MRALIACEESQAVCKALRAEGVEAYSCDTQPCSGGRPEWHIHDDVLAHLDGWDLIIAFPPCTHLAVSGARWFKDKAREQVEAIEFFMALAHAPAPKVAIENLVCIMARQWRPPDQIIQPWQFGHGETKTTCLWLRGLPRLAATHVVPGREARIWKMPPSPDRAKLRSKTYAGVAKAMAQQWGNSYPDLIERMQA